MKNNVIIYDFETVGYGFREGMNPHLADPIQVAALPMDGKTLKIDKSKAFMSMIKPTKGVNKVSKDSIEFIMKTRGWTEEQVKDELTKAPAITAVWPTFVDYVKSYRTNKTEWGLPARAGHNILNFDDIILARMNAEYGDGKPIFNIRDFIDTMNLMWLWMENHNPEEVTGFSMDFLRDYLGIDKKGGHDALKDCLDCSLLIKRFVRFKRYLTTALDSEGNLKLEFKNSFKNWKDED